MPPGGIRSHNLSRRAAADLRLRPRGHWDWQALHCRGQKFIFYKPREYFEISRLVARCLKVTRRKVLLTHNTGKRRYGSQPIGNLCARKGVGNQHHVPATLPLVKHWVRTEK